MVDLRGNLECGADPSGRPVDRGCVQRPRLGEGLPGLHLASGNHHVVGGDRRLAGERGHRRNRGRRGAALGGEGPRADLDAALANRAN